MYIYVFSVPLYMVYENKDDWIGVFQFAIIIIDHRNTTTQTHYFSGKLLSNKIFTRFYC